MKFLLLTVLSLFALNLKAQESTDIIIKSRFDYESSLSFIKRLRAFLMNNNFGDPYNQSVQKPIVIDLNRNLQDLPPGTQKWIKDLQSVLQLQLFESSYKIVVNDLSYSINDFNSELRPTVSYLNRVEYVTMNYVQGLTISATSIAFQVELKKTVSGDPITFSVEVQNPQFNIRPEMMVEMPMGWLTSIMPEYLLISLQQVDLKKLFDTIVKKPDLIDITVQDLKMPKVAIKIGNKTISFDREKIKKFFITRQQDMKKGVIDLIQARLGNRLENILNDTPQELIIPRTYALESKINAIFDIQEMSTNNSKLLHVVMDAHFCSTEEAVGSDFCWQNKIPSTLRREIPQKTLDKSVRDLNRYMIESDSNLGVSVSEHYLNQLINATMVAGLWEKDMADKEFHMGPEKAFVLGEEKGTTFSLYMDIVYKLKGAQRLLVGRSELRFPIKFGIGLNIVDIEGVPRLQIQVKKILTDSDLLIEGLPQYGIISTVADIRFRKKVIKEIMKEINEFNNNILVDLELPEFKGTYLEELEFFSDGLGRANASLRLGKKNKIGKML
jgi:hypothetical protein